MTQNDRLSTEIHFLHPHPLAVISLRIPWVKELQSGQMLTGYWGMTEAERASHDALLLNEKRWQDMPASERKSYLETLLLHTMMGYNITLSLLDDPQYAEFREHITSVLTSFSCRQEKLLRYIENIQA
jgi:hypothetical protein